MITSHGILYIEPRRYCSKEPVIDVLTKKMTAAYKKAIPCKDRYRGFHVCNCGASSKNYDMMLSNGEQTNSLCIHYLAYHRDEVSEEQISKVMKLNDGEVVPTELDMQKGR